MFLLQLLLILLLSTFVQQHGSKPCQAWAFPLTTITMTAYLSAIDLILSCSICQNPLSTIYGECDQNRGLRKGGVPQDDRITKLWLTECAHLICSNHFDGGGRTH